jgi:hypothetical protein
VELELSHHARLRIEQRKLDLRWVEQVVRDPEWSEQSRPILHSNVASERSVRWAGAFSVW